MGVEAKLERVCADLRVLRPDLLGAILSERENTDIDRMSEQELRDLAVGIDQRWLAGRISPDEVKALVEAGVEV